MKTVLSGSSPSLRLAVRGLALAGLVAAFPTATAAAPVVDQSNRALPTGNFTAVRSGFTASQTFVVGFPGVLTGVHVIVDSRGTPAADLNLTVQETTGGAANGNIVAGASVAPFAPGNPTIFFDVWPTCVPVSARSYGTQQTGNSGGRPRCQKSRRPWWATSAG